MKEKLKNSPWLQAWFYTQSPLVITRPALRETAACLGYLLSGFLLSCGRLGDHAVPFALGLLASVGGGIRGLTCLIGLAVGYLTMQPFTEGLQMTSSGILIYVCTYIFGTLWVTKRTWFRCGVAGAMTGAVGLIFLLSQSVTPQLLLGYGAAVATAALMPLSYDQLLLGRKRSAGSLLALASFLVGAAAIPLPVGMNLGCVMAAALAAVAARRADLPVAAAMAVGGGLALDAALDAGFWTVLLSMGACFGAGAGKRRRWLRVIVFALVSVAVLGWTGHLELGIGLDLALGILLSFLLPAGLIVGREKSAVEQSADLVEQRLTCGKDVLLRLYQAVGGDPEQQEDQEKNIIFDRAAAKVCTRCTRYSQCWERDARDTYRLLSPVLPKVLERGEARREDFPAEFTESCRQMDGLVLAVNQELERILRSSQTRARRQEERTVAGRMLLYLGRMLDQNARMLRSDQSIPREAYTVKLGVAAKGRGGSRISGDRGASLHTEDGRLYVILCDGVGTGTPAAEESLLAVDTLVELIQSGMPPESAMELLNGMYVLRDSGNFSTMDVLELNLLTGQGTLFKWGAAPSFLKSGDKIQRLGKAALPPGLGVDRADRAETVRLNLWSGDMLVLVSDGLDGAETETLLRDFQGENVKALAGALVDQAVRAGGEDDMTAAVVRLQEIRP